MLGVAWDTRIVLSVEALSYTKAGGQIAEKDC